MVKNYFFWRFVRYLGCIRSIDDEEEALEEEVSIIAHVVSYSICVDSMSGVF
jgi:hypothetical protein